MDMTIPYSDSRAFIWIENIKISFQFWWLFFKSMQKDCGFKVHELEIKTLKCES